MSAAEGGGAAPPSTGPSLVEAYDALVCDLDGVVHRGHRVVPGAAEALHRLVAEGRRVIYATNNAARPPEDVVAHLDRLGVEATTESVVTSAQAGAAHVRQIVPPGSMIVALGGPGVAAALAEVGLQPVPADAPEAVGVLQGLGPSLTVTDFAAAARHLHAGARWVATNADLTLPLEWGSAPGNGAYVQLLAGAVGREPEAITGKPAPPLYDLAIERLGLERERVLAVGDRLDTDIDGAAAAGLASAWVLTGVHGPRDLLASDRPSPTFVLSSLAELHEPYAAPWPSGEGWSCGDHHVSVGRDPSGRVSVRITPAGQPQSRVDPGAYRPPTIELVRAGLAALLEARDRGLAPTSELVEAAAVLHVPQP